MTDHPGEDTIVRAIREAILTLEEDVRVRELTDEELAYIARAARSDITARIAELEAMLDHIADMAERPAYRSLEVGFRHSPLTQKEIGERYAETCQFITEDARAALRGKEER